MWKRKLYFYVFQHKMKAYTCKHRKLVNLHHRAHMAGSVCARAEIEEHSGGTPYLVQWPSVLCIRKCLSYVHTNSRMVSTEMRIHNVSRVYSIILS